MLTAAIGLLYPPMLFLVSTAAGFMCLIVRVIRDAFAKAGLMKDGTVELAERIGTIAYSLSPVSWS